MNEKEVAELRRSLRPDRCAITHIRGCYVNERHEIISQFNEPLSMLSEADTEKYLSLLRKVLSGGLGRSLLELTFPTQQVVDGAEHRLLMALRSSALEDEDAVQAFFSRVIQSLDLEGNSLVLLAYDTYDVYHRGKDGLEQRDESTEQFRFLLCAVCPVKESKPALRYDGGESRFHIGSLGQTVGAPELGFLFPAFDDRATNIYGALYYARDTGREHTGFVDALFQLEPPMPALIQRETFQELLGEALEEDCNYQVVQAVQDHLAQMVEVHKQSHEPEPLTISGRGLRAVLSASGVSDAHAEAFDEGFNARFGAGAAVSPQNLVDTKHLEVRTPDVVIQVDPARSGLIQTRIIDGAKCIVIRAGSDVQVNGVSIQFPEDEK